MASVDSLLRDLRLNTVCEGARCPNIGRCFASGTATFMILGNNCTRNCTFCAVEKCPPSPLEADEPQRIVEAVRRLGLSYVVITSVTRDDLPDGGAGHFARTVQALHQDLPGVRVEVLIPDFRGDAAALAAVVDAKPQVLAHNLETVPRLYAEVRPQAVYRRSLGLLGRVKQQSPSMLTKSGIMLGLGETPEEVRQVLTDLRGENCDLLTLGQYLAPSRRHHELVRYVTPDEFAEYEAMGMGMGFRGVASAPLVRSSFRAGELYAAAVDETCDKSNTHAGGDQI
jgi:lipoic acid synthetase